MSRPAPQRHKARRISYAGRLADAELLVTEYHGSTGSAALSGRHYMRFQLVDLPALRLGLRPPAVRTDAAV